MKKTSLALAFAASLPMLAADAALACGSESYLGTICYTTYNWGCPQDTLPAAGQQLPISQYQALYSLLGTQFGGDGRNYFNLPDLRGRVIAGAGAGTGLTPLAVGAKGGAETATLNANSLPVTGSVTVGPNPTTGTPVAVRDPYLSLNACIVVNGLYPMRP